MFCCVVLVSVQTCVFTSLVFSADDHPLRAEYAKEFEAYPELASLASLPPPDRRTKASAIASGNRVRTGQTNIKDEAFRDVDLFTTSLWYHDKILHTLYDNAHQFANVIKHILIFIHNLAGTKVNFKESQRDYEIQTLGRFPDLAPNSERKRPPPPWTASKSNAEAIDNLARDLKVPSRWPAIRKIFAHKLFMKTAELLLLGGDAGSYFINLTDIRDDYKALFIELLRLLERCMFKVSTPGDRDHVRTRLPVVLTKLEMMLPINWCTFVMHVLGSHNLNQFLATGPFNVSNLMDIERFHTRYKGMARGTTDVMVSINNAFSLREASTSARLEDDINWTTAPTTSSVAGLCSRLDSSDRSDRVWTPKGAETSFTLSPEAYQQVQTLWADHYPVYADFHRAFNRVRRRRNTGQYANIESWTPKPGKHGPAPADLKLWRPWAKMTPVVKVTLTPVLSCGVTLVCISIIMACMLCSSYERKTGRPLIILNMTTYCVSSKIM